MMFIAATALALACLLAGLVYLVEFARVSRADALFTPASTGSARRARRVTGMYARRTGRHGGGRHRTGHHRTGHHGIGDHRTYEGSDDHGQLIGH